MNIVVEILIGSKSGKYLILNENDKVTIMTALHKQPQNYATTIFDVFFLSSRLF